MAAQFNARSAPISAIPELLCKADIVISSTASQLPILGKGAVEHALRVRKHRVVLMIDLAVPRDIEPQVGELEDIFLYTIDDLRKVATDGRQKRLEAVAQAEQIIDAQVDAFMRQSRSLRSVSLISDYRKHVETLKLAEVARAERALATGRDPREVVAELSHRLSNKLLHAPSTQLRKAAAENRTDLLQCARQILLPEPPPG